MKYIKVLFFPILSFKESDMRNITSFFDLDCVYGICSLFSWETFISEKCLVIAISCISKVKMALC